TDASGYVSAPVLTAGQTPGPVRVTATTGTVSTEFSLTVVAPVQYAVVPGGPPDVILEPGGGAGYPGVVVVNTGAVPIGKQTVTVRLPADKALQWGTAALPDYQLTILDGGVYPGSLSDDGHTLTFVDVDLDVPDRDQKVLWVGVSAAPDAPAGYTVLGFTVGSHACDSTPLRVCTPVIGPPFSAVPGGPPEVLLVLGGATGYPGVKLTNDGAGPVDALTVTVTLPQDTGLQWGQADLPDHQLTVLDAAGNSTAYPGTLSDDGQTLTFFGVDPLLPTPGSQSILWVGVSAAEDAGQVYTSLVFSLDGRQCPSTAVIVVPTPVFTLEPGGPPDVALVPGGPAGHPGVRVRNTGDSPLLADVAVTAAVPAGAGQFFAEQEAGGHLLTLRCPGAEDVHYTGRLSEDRQQLTADKVRLNVPAEAAVALEVAVGALPDAPAGPTALAFTVDSATSGSTPVQTLPPVTD
ncbi:hypothetical protein ACFC1T_26090, partial [Kitasatospora sp. NPDC056076]